LVWGGQHGLSHGFSETLGGTSEKAHMVAAVLHTAALVEAIKVDVNMFSVGIWVNLFYILFL